MIRKPQTIGFWRGRLPHWEVEDGRYFVTIHLAGAIPPEGQKQVLQRTKELQHCKPNASDDSSLTLMRTVFQDMERWLDSATENVALSHPGVAKMVIESIQYRIDTSKWDVFQFIVMPNHIHLFLGVLNGTLKESIEDFKRWTGHQAAKLTELPGGRFWQDEWFDHWSRSDEQDERIIKYIQQNPVKAGLVKSSKDWAYGSWHQ